jgi:hypothetical protein
MGIKYASPSNNNTISNLYIASNKFEKNIKNGLRIYTILYILKLTGTYTDSKRRVCASESAVNPPPRSRYVQ